ncbi:CRISPR-associated helicase Cas3' [Paenibacillus sp. YYML68]|uniref:CRISPR-associated helicase Cas3' n=1 Tax=Paenibacillus sp. YYML68 TaxID=2909250 RepID=UPI00249277AA|nr:CRISPR-associated helicase Cas3' [Paenibacillus sp. YYML68]
MEYIAHIRERDEKIQTVEEHLIGVKKLAESYGDKLGIKHIAGLAGMLHDMGKYTNEFRAYILEAVNNPDAPPKRGSVDHSTAGGKLLYQLYHTGAPSRLEWILAEVVGNAILSHHSYLHDFLNQEQESPYLKRVLKDQNQLPEYERSKELFFDKVISEADFQQYVIRAIAELDAFLKTPFTGSGEQKLMFLTKLVFSMLIDADRTDTRIFEDNTSREPEQDRTQLFTMYYEKLMVELNKLNSQQTSNERINELRREMSNRCDQFAEESPGIYTLSIPTGGGKTFASLRYALKHAKRYGKRQIFYIVPFTTIIEQNAREVREILDDDVHILEHHSNVIEDVNDDDEHQDGIINTQHKLKLAKDNWDCPIVFTTMVQFLNVFFAKGSRNIRRLHRLCESVIIFDEVQKVPVPCVSLFNQALNFLKVYGRSTLILCTATQPRLDDVEHKLDLNANHEMIQDLDRIIEAFKRVEIVDQATDGSIDSERLAQFVFEKLEEVQSILVILNTKTVVRRLYLLMKEGDIPIYHLSTSMCAAHRNYILGQVKERLERKEKVICVSTQLIEAGVDVSFNCVIRSLAGLDSIAQAAGRCNRHGKEAVQQVYVIDHSEENLKQLREIQVGKKLTTQILLDLRRDQKLHGGHLLSVQAMNKYFMEFYEEFSSSLNYYVPKLEKDMTDLLTSNRKQSSYNQAYEHSKGEKLPLIIVNSYRMAAEHFQVIEDYTTSVIVPYGEEGREIIAQLNGRDSIDSLSKVLRKAQQYSINLSPYEKERLERNDGLVYLLDGKVCVLKETAYNQEYGVDLDNDSNPVSGII